MNGIKDAELPKAYDKDNTIKFLIVAEKYQTGFDQPKLCAMYVMKKLKGVSAVQTLSRLNRICPPYDKKTFILDFANEYDDIVKAFEPYYTTTLLANSVRPSAIYDIEAKIDGYTIIDPYDIDKANELLYKNPISSKDKQKLTFLFQKSRKLLDNYTIEKQRDFLTTLKGFVRFYEFIIQVSAFEDVELHKKYNYISYLISFINISDTGAGYDLDGKIKASKFTQKKSEEHNGTKMVSDPVINLPMAEKFGILKENEKRLSEIIDEINSRLGGSFDEDVTVKSMLQIKDIMMKSEHLKRSAKNNSIEDFEFSYFDNIDNALIEGLSQNQDFFSLLLDNDAVKKEVLGVFREEIYNKLREE